MRHTQNGTENIPVSQGFESGRRCPGLTTNSTGATGYIGGDILYNISNKHPDYEIACLIRTQDKADKVKQTYPNIRAVLGGLDDSKLLEDEAAKADVVIRTSVQLISLHSLTHRVQTQQMPLTTRALPKQLQPAS